MLNNDPTAFENIFSFPDIKDIGIYYCGKRVGTKNHSYGPEIRSHYLIIYIKKGSATLIIGNRRYRLKSGQLFVMFPGENIYYFADKNSAWSISWIGIYGNIVFELLNSAGITKDKPIVSLSNPTDIENIFEKIYTESFSNELSSKLNIISLIYVFFEELISKNKSSQKKDIIKEVLHIIDYNFDKNINIEKIAESLFIDHSYLSRKFHKETGITIKEYIMGKKIQTATKLLTQTDAYIKTIANSVGIADSLYFSRIFKKKMGMPPSEYRSEYTQK